MKDRRSEEPPCCLKSKVVLEFYTSGLMVKGDTDAVRKLLEALGGRWDDTMNGWLFPFGSKEKIIIGLRVCGHGDTVIVEDRAEVRLTLSTFQGGVLVAGQTLPVEKFLVGQGGVWNAMHQGWFLDGFQKRELRRRLWKCRVVEAIEEID